MRCHHIAGFYCRTLKRGCSISPSEGEERPDDSLRRLSVRQGRGGVAFEGKRGIIISLQGLSENRSNSTSKFSMTGTPPKGRGKNGITHFIRVKIEILDKEPNKKRLSEKWLFRGKGK